MPKEVTELKVFISSPSDVEEERDIIKDVADSINRAEGELRGFHLKVIGSETTIPGLGDPQDLINITAEQADLVLIIFWRKFGTPTKNYPSGTIEEFALAMESYDKCGKPEVMVHFRDVDNQPKNICEFRKQLENNRSAYYSSYSDTVEFRELIHRYLVMWSATVISTSDNLIRQLEPFIMPVSIRDRAEEALEQIKLKFTELDKKYNIRGRKKALKYLRNYRFRFDGQFTIVDSKWNIIFHDEESAIGTNYSQFFYPFYKILTDLNGPIQHGTGTLKLINWLSSDNVSVDKAKRSGIKVGHCKNWVRFTIMPFIYFNFWDWYIFVEAHNEVHLPNINGLDNIIGYLQRNKWLIIPGRYIIKKFPRRFSGLWKGRSCYVFSKLFAIFRTRTHGEVDFYDKVYDRDDME